jgi:hypothetical protein
MTLRTEDWNEVADAVEGLALKLKMHFEEVTDEGTQAVKSAVDELGDAVERSFDALRNAVVDPAVKENVKEVAVRLREAVSNTFSELKAKANTET